MDSTDFEDFMDFFWIFSGFFDEVYGIFGVKCPSLWNTRYIKCIYKQNNDMYSLYVLDYFCYKEQLPSTWCHIHFIGTIDLSWHLIWHRTDHRQSKEILTIPLIVYGQTDSLKCHNSDNYDLILIKRQEDKTNKIIRQ